MEKKFRTSMFGFNRDDVAKYIYQQDKSYEKKLAEKDAACEKAEKACAEAEKNAADWRENVDKVKELRALTDRFHAASDKLFSEISRESEAMDAVEFGFMRLEDRCEKLEAFRDKANKFDSLAAALHDIFGNGVKNESVEALPEEAEQEEDSAIRQARVCQEQSNIAARDLKSISDEILKILESLHV